uniref:NADH dehydrogenase subunit 11 n=1 Tax=Proteomonas sulcata TaxID=77928 RepID=A0A2P1G8A4_9CRYP|nr:NADH dehydrogenase subunit 11 [Proteomonas sulcata]AVM81179.1 NADH dehydrogenase subunit 11 [Proteomonas sulcata]
MVELCHFKKYNIMSLSVIINGNPFEFNSAMSVLQACELAGYDIPRFCYHERLAVAGNCRMCLVEIEKSPKLVASCAMPLSSGMNIFTDSPAVRKAREGILELLLINHPLDCPICDQGGECDLQDQAMIYGSDRSRFREYKRAVEDKNCGPLVKTVMTRCIHCTRCVRFANDVIGLPDLGTSGRGNALEIGMYIERLFYSEFSGNVIDLCPVGALTSKPYSFLSRPWELKSVTSVDVFDSIGSNIRIDTRGYEIMRVLPNINEDINEEWISDKVRFSFDALKRQRLCNPLVKQGNSFKQISWLEAFEILKEVVQSISINEGVYGLVGPHADLESTVLLKKFFSIIGGGELLDFNHTLINNLDFQASYRFNTTLTNIDNSDLCLLIGVDPRKEGAILNLHLRKRYLNGGFFVANVGSQLNLTFPSLCLGLGVNSLLDIAKGRHFFCKRLRQAKRPLIIVGNSFLQLVGEGNVRYILDCILNNTSVVNNHWCGLNFLNSGASSTGVFDVGFTSTKGHRSNKNPRLLYILGDTRFSRPTSDTFIVYQGHQGHDDISQANLVLPGAAFTEKVCTFVNTEGRYQTTQVAVMPPGNAREDWKILHGLLEFITNGRELKFSLDFVSDFDSIPFSEKNSFFSHRLLPLSISEFTINDKILISSQINNFYFTDIVTETSPLMSKCSKNLLKKAPFFL